MSSSRRVELRITYAHDPKIMGYIYCQAVLHDGSGQGRRAFSWNRENGVMSRMQLVEAVIDIVQDLRPTHVGFRAVQHEQLQGGILPPEEFNYWSPETLRAVIDGTRTAADLLVV